MPGSGDAENTSTARTQLWCMELLSSLDRSVFLISPEHYLRAERLLDQIGPLEHFERLRTLIAPIVVTNAQQAERFDEAFYAYQRQLDAYQELMVAEEPPPPKDLLKKNRSGGSSQGDRKSSRTSLKILVPLLVVVLAAVTTFWPIRFPFESKPPGVIVEGKPAVSTRPNPVEQSVAPGDASVPLTRLSPTPFAVDPATWWELQGDRIRAGVFGIPLLLLAILFALHRRRRKLIAERASKATGPIVIKFQAPKPTTGPFGDDELRRTARETRRRQRSATTRLSIARSVRATVESLGFPTLVYEAVTRPPEYVVFIEELSPADHQARYYEALIDRLDAEGAIVTRYRYQRDPRLSFEKERNDQDKRDSVWLGDIFQMHSDARLVLIGDGQGFVDPFTGVLLDWVSMLESWEERAFLTTVVPSRWNQRELMLADRFVVLPATLEGLRAVTTHFDAGTKPDLRELRARLKTLPAPENNSIPTIAQLKEYFAETAGFPWLCACAVYPELRWEITAYLATIPSLSAGTFTEESVLRLVALPWFRTGAFPDELRIDLLEELSTLDAAQHSSIEADARTAINTVWGSVSSLDSGSKADLRRQRMQLINELHLYRNDRSRVREIFAKLRGTVPAGTLARDVTVVRAASGFRISRLAHVLPDRLREKLFVGGEPLLGVRPSALAVPAFLLMATAAATWSFGKGARVDLTNFEVDPEVVVAPIGDSVTFRAFGKFSSADRRAAGVYWGVTGRGESRSPLILVDTTAAFGSTYKTVALRVSDPQGFKTDLVVRAGVGRNHAASTLYAVDNQRTDSAAVRASLLRPRTGVTGVWLDVDSAIAKLFPDVRTDGAMTLCGQTPNQNFTVSGSRFQTSDAGWVVARAKTTAGSIFMPIYVSNSTLDSNDMELLEPLDINAPDERTPSLDSKARLMNKDSLLRLKVLSWAEVAMLDSHITGTIEAASFASELSRKLTYQKTVTVTNDVLRDLEGCLGKTDVPLDMFDYLRSRLYFQFSRPSSLDVIWASAYGGVWKTASGLQYAFSLKIPQARDLAHLNATIKWTLINTGGNRELSAKVGTSATGSVTGMLDTAKRTATFAMVKSASDTLIGPDGYRLTFDSAFARLTGQTRKGTGSWVGNIDGRQGLLNNWDALADCNALRPSVRDLSLSLVEGQSVDVPAAGAASRLVALSPWYVDDMSRMPVSVSASGHITTNVSGATTVRFQCAGIRDSVRVRVQSSSLDPKVRAQLIQPSAFIYFDENKSDINTEARKILDQWAKLLTEQKNNSLTIDVTGNTQAIGSEKYNLKLGQDKADQAKAYLVGKGVAESRINARTVGESDPIASNTTDAGRRLNGRVVITPTGNRRGESAKF